jgi:hypothetical protein
MSRAERVLRSPLLLPCLLAVAYLVLLVVRFPQLIGWENADSDIASAYVLTDAVSLGHTGHVVMSTQGSWVPLWYGLVTAGLGFHRVLWEISPALLTLATALLIGWSVSRLSGRLAGALSVALIVAASPTALFPFSAAFFHNTTIPGVALLGAYLVWITAERRTGWRPIAAGALMSLLVGTFLASDEMLAVVGIVPFLGVAVLRRVRARERTGFGAVLAVGGGSIAVALITSAVMGSLNFSTTTPRLRFTSTFIPLHLKWLVQGLLRIGNGLSVAPHSEIRTPLVAAAGLATISALAAMFWLAGRSTIRPGAEAAGRARDAHLMFWASSLLCAAAAYVVTTVVSAPTDRYLVVAVPAVAATVPLLVTGPRASWLVATGATIFIAASIVSLAANDARRLFYEGATVPVAARLEAFVRSHHLEKGYAGYWDAANLDWVSHERLHVYPLTDRFGPTEPMYLARAQAWYRSRPNTPTYLLLAPNDADLVDTVPRDLPAPSREVRIGPITVAVYPYDIAAYLHAPSRLRYLNGSTGRRAPGARARRA